MRTNFPSFITAVVSFSSICAICGCLSIKTDRAGLKTTNPSSVRLYTVDWKTQYITLTATSIYTTSDDASFLPQRPSNVHCIIHTSYFVFVFPPVMSLRPFVIYNVMNPDNFICTSLSRDIFHTHCTHISVYRVVRSVTISGLCRSSRLGTA
ncbi:hypothetical protein BC827DRAFT_29496 [Russula dissimulans]|jgi:hypothetical protein|nr:hypothetical protein BC827DRAFT_29496 [Russula dissimulans]